MNEQSLEVIDLLMRRGGDAINRNGYMPGADRAVGAISERASVLEANSSVRRLKLCAEVATAACELLVQRIERRGFPVDQIRLSATMDKCPSRTPGRKFRRSFKDRLTAAVRRKT